MRAVVVLFDDPVYYEPPLFQSWLPASTLIIGLLKCGRFVTSIVNIDAQRANSAMSKSNLYCDLMIQFDGTNQTGVF